MYIEREICIYTMSESPSDNNNLKTTTSKRHSDYHALRKSRVAAWMTPKPGNNHSKGRHFVRNGCPKGIGGKTHKTESGTQIHFFNKD